MISSIRMFIEHPVGQTPLLDVNRLRSGYLGER